MLELKEKMNSMETTLISMTTFTDNKLFENAVSVLLDWGVQKSVAEQIVKDNISAEDNLETLLAKAFKDMGR